jgi:hypothetical protein
VDSIEFSYKCIRWNNTSESNDVWGKNGTLFGVLQDSQGSKYAVTSSHVLQNSQHVMMGGRVIGKTIKDGRPCGQKGYLDAAAALVNQGPYTN